MEIFDLKSQSSPLLLFLKDNFHANTHEYIEIAIDLFLERVKSLIDFFHGDIVNQTDLDLLSHSNILYENSKLFSGGAHTLFAWKFPTNDKNIPFLIIKPYYGATIESLIYHTASVYYLNKNQKNKFKINNQIILLKPMTVLGITSYRLDSEKIIMNIPILIQEFSPVSVINRSTNSKLLINSTILIALLKKLSKNGFTFDANLSNWYHNLSEKDNILKIDYIDLVYYNIQSEIHFEIQNIRKKLI